MPAPNALADIAAALTAFAPATLRASSLTLLAALGYRSDRTLPIPGAPDPAAFRSMAEVASGKTLHAEKAKFAEWTQAELLFQLTDTEVRSDQTLFQDADLEPGLLQSALFFAIELRGKGYSRTALADVTRQINRLFPMPVVVLFSYAGRLSLAVVHRRQHHRDPNRDVLGRVSLIRDIDTRHPHRAHLDILHALSLPERIAWLDAHKQPRSFDGLLAALLAALDTEALNKRFYTALFAWFTRAVTEATFPTKQPRTLAPEEHVIRLITRLLFVWFVKEKGLIAAELFTEAQVAGLLKDYDRDTGDSYYRAVVQNLFFATLNTEIAKRGFSREHRATHRDFSRYRYRKEMQDPAALLALFRRTPFINGGLFDCLDSETPTQDGGWRIDCFTDTVTDPKRREYGLLSIPNRLFFDATGLITLFDRFTFTVEENTPAEQDVALDPELLGKVFENLLAAVTPETRETARKQTGSYYTPRAVVDYMVDEALVAALADRVQPADGAAAFWQARLHYLLDYADAFADADELFTDTERDGVVRAIADTTVLDPAVGSGAFPMGVLHKLTLALRRLDPDNRRWEALQKERARARMDEALETRDRGERDAELLDISATFERYRDSDFGRKLYLIQNSIFGVDIQPVASQIAKLRFFISLAIEQAPTDDEAANYGIKPLPNLETRFVAANTLLGLDKPAQQTLGRTARVARLERALHENRERHFHATTRPTKTTCRKRDAKLRTELAAALRTAGFPAADANKIAQWDPYDQNASADWFDAEYMFGLTTGFAVVLGNPPYVQLQKNGGALGRLYKDAGFETFARTGDLYQLFYEQGCRLLAPDTGLLAYITSNSWLKAEYGKATRRYMADKLAVLRVLEMGKDVFENAIVDTSVLIARSGKSDVAGKAIDMDRLAAKDFPPAEPLWGPFIPQGEKPWSALSATERAVMDKLETVGTPLKEWDVTLYRGVTTGLNDAFIIDDETKERLVAADPKSAELLKPVLRGRDIQRYRAQWASLWLITTFPSLQLDIDVYPAVKSYLLSFGKGRLEQSGKQLAGGGKARKKTQHLWFEAQDATAYHEDFAKEKLIWIDLTDRGRFVYDDGGMFCVNTAFIMSGNALKYLCAILNSKLTTWYMNNTALNSGMGVTRWIPISVERIPIPHIPMTQQRPFIRLVDRILQAKTADPAADTTAEEAEIDRLVYALYGLTEAEVAAVESR